MTRATTSAAGAPLAPAGGGGGCVTGEAPHGPCQETPDTKGGWRGWERSEVEHLAATRSNRATVANEAGGDTGNTVEIEESGEERERERERGEGQSVAELPPREIGRAHV